MVTLFEYVRCFELHVIDLVLRLPGKRHKEMEYAAPKVSATIRCVSVQLGRMWAE